MANHAPQTRAPRSGPRTKSTTKSTRKTSGPRKFTKATPPWMDSTSAESWKGAKKRPSQAPAKARHTADSRTTPRGEGATAPRSTWRDRDDRPQRADRSERPQRTERTERPRSARPQNSERPQRTEQPRTEQPRTERPQRSERPQRTERFERPVRTERFERADRPERQDRPDHANRASRPQRPERFERGPRTDRPRTVRPRNDRPRTDRPRTDRPRNDRPRNDRPRNDRRDRPEREQRAPRVPALTGPNAFVDLGVPASIAAVLASQSITEPTPIQAMTIPAALGGRDVLGRGRTGSGKTLSFGLPMLTILAGPRPVRRQPRGLILAPTRELAMQVVDALAPLAATLGMRTQLIIGGSSYDRQIRGLERADIVVATPGRLVDLADRGSVDLGAIKLVVLDEADHMADLGFMPEIEAIMGRLPDDAQGLLFSATLDHDVDRLVRKYLHDPVVHNADPATATVGTMEHHLVLVHPKDKDAVTADIALRRGRTVAFVRTQMGADRLAGQLEAEGVRTAALHGGMKQGMRTRTLEDFRRGRIDVLVATDVAARGLHVDDIDLVLHVDPPHGPKEYLHRSGRTARAGASGTVISLATLRQERSVTSIASRAGVNPAVMRVRPGDAALMELIS